MRASWAMGRIASTRAGKMMWASKPKPPTGTGAGPPVRRIQAITAICNSMAIKNDGRDAPRIESSRVRVESGEWRWRAATYPRGRPTSRAISRAAESKTSDRATTSGSTSDTGRGRSPADAEYVNPRSPWRSPCSHSSRLCQPTTRASIGCVPRAISSPTKATKAITKSINSAHSSLEAKNSSRSPHGRSVARMALERSRDGFSGDALVVVVMRDHGYWRYPQIEGNLAFAAFRIKD